MVRALGEPEDVKVGRMSTRRRESTFWKTVFGRPPGDRPRNRVLAAVARVFLHLHPARVRRHGARMRFTWCMGGISFLLFLVLTVTGVYLMFHYHPTKAEAYEDMQALRYDVPFGSLLRNLHRWAAHLMVITVVIHMFRVFSTGSYKPPRQFNWLVGVLLLVLTLLMSFSGYLLPDDQLGYWAVTVGTNMARDAPLIGHGGPVGEELGLRPGDDAHLALLGGTEVGGNALLRAYVWHCLALPLLAALFCALHFWRVRKDGGISGPL